MSRDEHTYGKIRRQFDEWAKLEANRPARAHLRRDLTKEAKAESSHTPRHHDPEMSRLTTAAIGFGIAGILLLLAAYSFFTASYYNSHARDGAAVGFALVGIFLCIAGIGGGIAVWNHHFRVLTGAARPHH